MEYKGVCHNKPKTLLMKVTSRERPEVLLKTVSEYISLANDTRNMVWLYTFDEDDNSCNNLSFIYRLFDTIKNECNVVINGKITGTPCVSENCQNFIFYGNSNSKIEAVNRDVNEFSKYVDWDILVNISDDQRPIVAGYDDIIRKAMPDDLDWSLWFSDGVQPRISTMEILGRAYYERFNYIYNPLYKSFFCDNESTLIAQKLGKQIKSNQCIIKHEHYAAPGGKIKFDALYEKNNKHWKHDEDLYNKRLKINFGL